MQYEKQKYEQLIMDSQLFTLDREQEYAAYKKESIKMTENLYCYLMAVNREKYEGYSCEIMEVAARCINNFDKGKGVFLHYFNAAWKKEYSHICGKQILDDKYGGMHISEEYKRAVKNYILWEEKLGTGRTKEELYEILSETMNLPVEKIIEIAKLENINYVSDVYEKDEEERSIWDYIDSGEREDEVYFSKEELEGLLSLLETSFDKLQDRQKPVIADMLTIKIHEVLIDIEKKYSFVNSEILMRIIKERTIPSQREIAAKYGKNEASISRTYKDFIKKVKEKMSECSYDV